MREQKLYPKMTWFDTKITCNRCGQIYDLEKDELEEWQADFMRQFTIRFGYTSAHDTEDWHFDLCEECLEEIIKEFKIAPEITNYL